jgi:catechol 2,3-dioxygenase-like lactoylglutathione lyase family enzyme
VPIRDIDHIQIAAPKGCEAAAREFFGRLLGLQEVEKPAGLRGRGGCWFKVGTRQLHIGIEEPFQPARKAHPAFAVSRIEELYEALTGSRIECQWDEAIDGVRRFFADDPWGNRLEFTESAAEPDE